jgi:hypothetical protein
MVMLDGETSPAVSGYGAHGARVDGRCDTEPAAELARQVCQTEEPSAAATSDAWVPIGKKLAPLVTQLHDECMWRKVAWVLADREVPTQHIK